MKKLGFWLFLVISISLCFGQNPSKLSRYVENPLFSQSDKKLIYDIFNSNGLEKVKLIEEFLAGEKRGEINQSTLSYLSVLGNEKEARKQAKKWVLSLRKSFVELELVYLNRPQGLFDKLGDLIFSSKKAKDELKKVETSFHQLESFFHKERKIHYVVGLLHAKEDLIYLFQNFIESFLLDLPTSRNWAKEISVAVNDFEKKYRFIDNQKKSAQRWKSFFKTEEKYQVRKAYLNQDNVMRVAEGMAISGFVACSAFSAGLCAGTAPILQSARGILAASAGVRTADRYLYEGRKGLLTFSTALDLMIIATCLPTPGGHLRNLVNKSGQLSVVAKLANKVTFFQQDLRYLLGYLGIGYSTYLFVDAPRIAKQLTQLGEPTSVWHIRAQALTYFFISYLTGAKQHNKNQAQFKKDPAYQTSVLSKTDPISFRLKAIAAKLVPGRSLVDLYRSVRVMTGKSKLRLAGQPMAPGKNFWQRYVFQKPLNPKNGVSGFGPGVKELGKSFLSFGLQALGVHVYTFMAYTYPDFSFDQKITRPVLKDGEIALLLNGLSDNDLLYYGFSDNYALKNDIRSYGLGVYTDYFKDREDLWKKIEHYSQFGKIKYLKIMMHGMPGMLIPSATKIDNFNEHIIDKDYLLQNKTRLQKMARKSFANDVHVNFTSCLVAATLEKDMNHKGMFFAKDAGPRFFDAWGETIMATGGRVDASKRIIMGLDATYGVFLNHVFFSELAQKDQREVFERVSNIKNIYRDLEQNTQVYKNLFERNGSADIEENMNQLVVDSGIKIVDLYKRIWTIIDKFGFNLEGGVFTNAHYTRQFPKL